MDRRALANRLRRPEGRRFVAFLLTGGVAAGLNVVSRAVFGLVAPYETSVALAYLVGMTTAFFLTRLFVFAGTGRGLHVEYGRFALVNVAALVQVVVVSMALARIAFPLIGFTWHAELIAHTVGVLSPVLASYQGHKRFSFA